MPRVPEPAGLKLLKGRHAGVDSGGRPVEELTGVVRTAPDPPPELPAEARAEWRRVVAGLEQLGLLKDLDRAAVACYCIAWHRFVEAQQILDRDGPFITSSEGTLHRHPAQIAQENAARELRLWCQELGLTPSSEQRVAATQRAAVESDPSNPFAG